MVERVLASSSSSSGGRTLTGSSPGPENQEEDQGGASEATTGDAEGDCDSYSPTTAGERATEEEETKDDDYSPLPQESGGHYVRASGRMRYSASSSDETRSDGSSSSDARSAWVDGRCGKKGVKS